MNRNFFNVLFVIAASVLLTSCYSYKKTAYLQVEELQPGSSVDIPLRKKSYKLRTNDVLSVVVQGTEEEVTDVFNIAPANVGFTSNESNLFLGGHSVNGEGFITLPIIGKIKVEGKTTEEAQQIIQEQVDNYLNNATVIVKLISFRVTVLGEVNSPGHHYVYNEQLTVLEAIGLSGGIMRTGRRNNVKLIRQISNDSTKVVMLDLTRPGIVNSEYYFLQPNDVVYVEPFRTATTRVNLNFVNIIFSAVTTTLLVLNFMNN